MSTLKKVSHEVHYKAYARHAMVVILNKKLPMAQIRLQCFAMENSCGIYGLEGISNLLNVVYQLKCFDNHLEVIKEALITLFKAIKAESNLAFLILSNNDNTPQVNSLLDEIAKAQTNYEKNPNSGSLIKVWVV